uniref:NADH dehydrogenase [ubiquinone] 1 beta subcomplex subunit 7 n=1 Tax=Ixodes ricinus TaxID=34613 RepID=A0A0K8RBL0_IXORI
MGNVFGNLTTLNATSMMTVMTPEVENFKPSFDPMLGFPNGRKRREMVATEAELESARIPPKNRTYCAHKLIEFKACRKDHFPLVYRCQHEKHEYEDCMYQDYLIRYKEYERERRLRAREEQRRRKQAAENLE